MDNTPRWGNHVTPSEKETIEWLSLIITMKK